MKVFRILGLCACVWALAACQQMMPRYDWIDASYVGTPAGQPGCGPVCD